MSKKDSFLFVKLEQDDLLKIKQTAKIENFGCVSEMVRKVLLDFCKKSLKRNK